MPEVPVRFGMPKWVIAVAVVAALAPGNFIVDSVRNRADEPTLAATPPTTGYFAEFGGQPETYSRIASLTNCAELQSEFERAGDRNDLAAVGSDEFNWTLGYMTAAEDRLQEVGCYSS